MYNWKNNFYEMKGDVGLSLHEKERNKMPTPRHKVTHNPIPTSLLLCMLFVCLFVCLFVMNALGKANSTQLQNVCCGFGRNKDVGMGL